MDTNERLLKIKFAGRFIDLLGHQMYGGPVPSVAELVANSWDADSTKVEIAIPEDVFAENAEITVKDCGIGMTFDELNEYYLNIGYETRKKKGDRTPGGRLVMGRKGIGKLAGFGIAEDIVLRSVKNKHLVQFTLNYTFLKSQETIGSLTFFPEIDKPINEQDGVMVIFKKLKLGKAINIESFKKSMSRRFAFSADKMMINVNGEPILKENLKLSPREPEKQDEWKSEVIPGFGPVRYWMGFLKNTIQDSEMRGITVFAKDRVAQYTPFHFNLTGGINGQVALEYLTGQVQADVLDEDIDYIATDRQSVNWQLGNAYILEKWGQEKIKELCSLWKKLHTKKKVDRFKHNLGEYFLRIEKLASVQERKDLTTALEKVASIDNISEEDFETIASSMVAGFERESVKKIIKRINEANEDALPELFEVVKEWDIISAVLTAEAIAGKIGIIDKFEKLIDARTPEKAPGTQIDMQKFIKSYPWLLGHEYEQFQSKEVYHEKEVDKWIKDIILKTDKEFREDSSEERRFDLIIFKNSWRIIVLELMRPGKDADIDHVNRLLAYVTRIEDAIQSKGTMKEFQNVSVYGLLIADNYAKSGALKKLIQNNRNLIDAVEWKGLFESVHARYKDFYELLKKKAPDDPRMQGIS